MRIVHLNTNLRWGGGENQLFHLLQGTKGGEFSPFLLARGRGELIRRVKETGIDSASFDFVFRYGPLAIGRLAGLLREKEARILHIHDGEGVSLGAPAAALNPQVKLVVHRRIASPMRNNWLTRWKYSPKRVSAYVAVSESAKKSLLNFGIPEEKIHLIPSGIDLEQLSPVTDRIALRRELNLPEGIWIGTVTTLEAKKNNETFLRAAAQIGEKIPEAKFLLVGDGPQRKQLEGLAFSLGLKPDQFHFAGFQERAARFTAAMDLFLFPSLLEGSPGALKEAMALETPVIAANAPGNQEIVRDRLGILVPPSDAQAYAQTAVLLLQNREEAQKLAKAAAVFVRENFSMKSLVEKTTALYRELTKS